MIKTEIVTEKHLIDCYYDYIQEIRNNEYDWGELDADEVKCIDTVLSFDKDSVTILELLLIDPIFAPRMLQRQCTHCRKTGYSMMRVNSVSSVFFICKDCCHELFVKPFEEEVDTASL